MKYTTEFLESFYSSKKELNKTESNIGQKMKTKTKEKKPASLDVQHSIGRKIQKEASEKNGEEGTIKLFHNISQS